MSGEQRGEIGAIAEELVRHLRWAQDKGERELPLPPAIEARSAAEALAGLVGASQVSAAPRAVDRSTADARTADARTADARTADARAADARAADARIADARAADARAADARAADARVADARVAELPPAQRLERVRADLGDCTRCKLCDHRKNIVFGDGNPAAELVFVGEGPGFEEDQRGLPFVGPAGQLLERMIQAMGYQRSEVYICNVVKCRPPRNRDPEPDEVAACEPFLQAQLAAIRPKAIVALGKFASQALLRDPAPISRLRGTWREYQGIPTMPTFHPAYLLRAESEKGKAWQDLQQVMALLGKRRP